MNFTIAIGQLTPPSVGLPLTRLIAKRLARQKDDPVVRAVRANQWVVSDGTLTSDELDEAVLEVFEHQARCLYTLYHNFRSPQGLARTMELTPKFKQVVEDTATGRNSYVMVGLHMSNFDQVLYGAGQIGLHGYVLGVSNPSSGYRKQYALRSKDGLEVVASSKQTLREAEHRLREGKTVMTGADRALPGSRYAPLFFNRPAPLPALYVNLALKTERPVVVVAAIMEPNGIFKIHASDLIEMKPYADRKTSIMKNAETVLAVGEEFIRMAPTQWMMFYSVWPEALTEMPQ